MTRTLVRSLAAVAVGVISTLASAQIVALPLVTWKYRQPWTKPWHSHASVVRDCQGGPVQFAPIAFDDWVCTKTGPIVRLRWWGTSPQPNQVPPRNFYIAIYSDANCRPAQLLYRTCVLATNTAVSIDCRDRRVFRFNANLPTGAAGFSQVQGTRYWLQISEADNAGTPQTSPTPNAVDFEWSAHRPIKNCPAGRRSAAGVFQFPLIDECDQIEEDLAFELASNAIIGHVDWSTPTALRPGGLLPNPVFSVEYRRADDGALVDTESFTPEEDGSFALTPELPAGAYRCYVRGMGSRTSFFDIFFEEGGITDVGTITLAEGDVDGDGDTDFGDISQLLANWRP